MQTKKIKANLDFLPAIFDTLPRHGKFPPQWEHAIHVPIPETGKTNLSNLANIRPNFLLLCLGKLFQIIIANQLAVSGTLIGLIAQWHKGSRAWQSVIDALIIPLTQTQAWLHTKGKPNNKLKGPEPIRPSLMPDDVNRACNCALHNRLIEIMTNYQVPNGHCKIIRDFTTGWTISMKFDGQTEQPTPFKARLTHGSPLSQILIILIGYALITPTQLESIKTPYLHDEVTLQQAMSIATACNDLQERLNTTINRGHLLNIIFVPHRAELMHLIATTSKLHLNRSREGIILEDMTILPMEVIKSLGVFVDHWLSFCQHLAATSTKTKSMLGFIYTGRHPQYHHHGQPPEPHLGQPYLVDRRSPHFKSAGTNESRLDKEDHRPPRTNDESFPATRSRPPSRETAT